MRIVRPLLVATVLVALAGCSGQDADRGEDKPSASGKVSPNPLGSAGTKGAAPKVPSPKPNFVVTTCRTDGLSMRLGGFSKNGDETSVNLYIKHVRGPSCTLSGYGSLALFAEDGSEVQTVLVDERVPVPATIKFQAGTEAVKRLRWSTEPAADEPQTGPCAAPAIILSVRLTELSVSVDLYTKSNARPDGIGAVCNHGRLMQTAWQPS